MQWRQFLSFGILDSSENTRAKKVGRVFDFLMLFAMFWLPLQWYAEFKGLLSETFITTSNWIIWGFFVIETSVMLKLVNKKWQYLLGNWLNLLIIVLAIPPLWSPHSTYFALLRYIRFIILLRLFLPQLHHIHRLLSRNHFGLTLVIFLLVTFLSAFLISYIDPGMGGLWAGLWWALQTVTTVGYGDIIPNTVIGKIFASLLMLIGVGLFSLVSANLAAYFIERGQRQKGKKPERKTQQQLRDVSDRLMKLEENQRVLIEKMDQILQSKKDSEFD